MAVIFCVFLFAQIAQAEVYGSTKTDKEKPQSICPKTLMSESCLQCHVVSAGKWTLKETKPDAHLDYPTGTKIFNYGKPDAYGYYEVGEISYSTTEEIKNFFDYLRRHNVNKAVVEIISGGGHLLLGWRIKAFIDEWQAEGRILETRVRCLAASAAFLVFVAGSRGHRIANSTSELMMHELKLVEGGLFWFKQTTPSSAEEEAKTLRHLQTTVNEWLAKRGKLSREKIEEMLRFKEFWMNGKQAWEHGFADVVVGE